MARFLFVVPPLAGHVNPTVAVADALTRRGHEVAWVGYVDKIRALLPADARLFALDERAYAAIEAEFAADALRVRGLESWALMWRKLLVPLCRAMLPGVDAAIDEWAPDVVIADQQALAGALAARRRAVPWATSCTSAAGALLEPLRDMPKLWAFMQELMDGLCRDAGMLPVERPDNSPQLVLVFTAREFLPAGDVFPDHFAFVGPAIGARPPNIEFPWERLDDTRRKLLVSLGSLNAERGGRFFATACQALADEPIQVVMVAPPEAVTEVPDNFIVQRFVPQLALLPRMDAVVCHAGQNTVTEALSHGLPLVVAPIKDDQPMVASLVVQSGAGLRLKFGRLRAADLRDAVRAVLDEPACGTAARQLQRALADAGGAPRAAERLEGLIAAEGRP